MTGTDHPEAPPPEVPEEFAAAYREAYRRALESDDPVAGLPEVPPQEVVLVGTHRSEGDARPSPRGAGWRAARWFPPVLIAGAALLLVLAAYAVGVALSGDDEPGAARPSAAHTTADDSTGSPEDEPTSAEPSTSPGGWEGPVTEVTVSAVSADCRATPSNDASGRRVTYDPENVADDRTQTAWRCPGTAVGEKLTLRISGGADIAEVGLIPGYAKTDPESGVDRYAENNRITKVRWTLGDGVSIVQRLDPDPSSRALQLLRVPLTSADTVTLEILAVKRGPRNTTAISDISLSSAQ